MKNCVYYCFYGGDTTYLNLLKLSLKSLNRVFSSDNIIVFSDRRYEGLVEYCNLKVVNFPDGYAIPMAYRLILGKRLLENYDKVLHLDLDTIITHSLDNIFSIQCEDKISFASENGNHLDKIVGDCWAGPLLTGDEKIKYQDIKSICCGVFLFDKTFYNFLENIYDYIVLEEDNGFRGICRDQHAFTAYLLRNNIFDYQLQHYVTHLAQGLVSSNSYNIDSSISIYHFAGGVTSYNKYRYMEKLYLSL